MSYNELINLLPDSIMSPATGGGHAELWEIFAEQMDEVDQALEGLRLARDVFSQGGVILDLVGEILREPRLEKDDPAYRIYLLVALQKLLCSGSIPSLQNVLRAILGDDFIGVYDLTPLNRDAIYHDDRIHTDGTHYLDGSFYLSGLPADGDIDAAPYVTYLDGSIYLDGGCFLSGDIIQPGFFEIRVKSTTAPEMKEYIDRIIRYIKGGGIKYRILEVEV